MKPLRWSQRAARDLVNIGDFIAADDPEAARRWLERLRARTALAAATPLGGRKVPELDRDDVREIFIRTYRLVCRVLPRQIVVLTVFEGHRRFPPAIDPNDA
jgi:toxin ParE1/3/4